MGDVWGRRVLATLHFSVVSELESGLLSMSPPSPGVVCWLVLGNLIQTSQLNNGLN